MYASRPADVARAGRGEGTSRAGLMGWVDLRHERQAPRVRSMFSEVLGRKGGRWRRCRVPLQSGVT